MIATARRALAKLTWGVRVVGPAATVVGLARLVRLTLQRPPETVLHLRSGPRLALAWPRERVPALVVFGDYIDPEMPFLRRVARPDWVVVDVGAAIGQFAVFAALLPVQRVHAFEPGSDNLRSLAGNLARNGVADRVVVEQLALADDASETTFPTSGNPFLGRPDSRGGGEVVPVRRLDETLERLGLDQVDCLKINVAGYEAEVLAGAEPFLARQGADVLVILISEGSTAWFPRLAEHGYRFFHFHPPTGRVVEVEDLHDVARRRPWPARHLIGVSGRAVAQGVLGDRVLTAPQ